MANVDILLNKAKLVSALGLEFDGFYVLPEGTKIGDLVLGDVGCIKILDYPEAIISDWENGWIARVNLEDKSVIWSRSGFTNPWGLDYDPVNDRVVVAIQGGVIVLKGSDGSTIVQNTSITSNAVRDAQFDPIDPNMVLLADGYRAWKYDISGNSATEIASGHYHSITRRWSGDKLKLAGEMFAEIRSSDGSTVEEYQYYPLVGFIATDGGTDTGKGGNHELISAVASPTKLKDDFGYRGTLPYTVLVDLYGKRPMALLPWQTDAPRFSLDRKWISGASALLWYGEVSKIVKYFPPYTRSYPTQVLLAKDQTVSAGGTFGTLTINPIAWSKIKIYWSADASLNIHVTKPVPINYSYAIPASGFSFKRVKTVSGAVGELEETGIVRIEVENTDSVSHAITIVGELLP